MPADGMHAAAYAKTEFRRPFLGSSKQIYHAFLTLESRATRRFHHAANVSCWPITTCCTGGSLTVALGDTVAKILLHR